MEPDFAVQVLREALGVMFDVAGPVLLVALVVGTLIAVLQAATQVNEMTLTFVPKLAAIGVLLWVLSSFLLGKLTAFSERMFELVAVVGGGALTGALEALRVFGAGGPPLATSTDVLAAPLALVEPFVFGAALVFARVAGVLLGLPVLGNPAVPPAFRALLLFWVSILVFVAIGMPPVPLTVDLLEALPLFLGDFLVGAAMGFAARLLLAVAEGPAPVMGLSAGLGLATAMDPVTGQSGNTVGSLLLMLSLVLFVTLGGHAAVVGALLDSYHRYPLGDPAALPGLLENVVDSGASLFELSLRLAAPLAVVALVVNVAMGLLVRVAPALNLFAIGFLVVIGASLLLLYHEVPAIAVELKGAMEGLRESLVIGRWGQ